MLPVFPGNITSTRSGWPGVGPITSPACPCVTLSPLLAVWLAPREVIFPGWHAFVGFQNGGVCPGRSPSMWVDGGGHGDNPPGVHKGLHYDSCDESTSTRYAGVLENFFTTPGEYVHVVWTKQGNQYYFYKNGQPVEGSWRAPDRVQLSDQYNIGHNDNYFDGKIDEVAFFDFALSPNSLMAFTKNA